MSIKDRFINAVIANLFSQGANILIQILSIPLFIKYWGIDIYGDWLILITIPAYLSISDFGFTTISGNLMAMEVARNQRKNALVTFQSTIFLLLIISIIILFITYIFNNITLFNILNVNNINSDYIEKIIYILALYVVINLQNGLIGAALRSGGFNVTSIWIANISRLCEFTISIIALIMGGDPFVVAEVYLIVRIFTFISSLILLKMNMPWIKYGIRFLSIKQIKLMIKPSLFFMAFPLSNAIKNQGMISIVGINLGSAMVVGFIAMRTLINGVQQIMGVINGAIWPEFSKSHGSGDTLKTKNLHRLVCGLSFWLSAIAIIFIALFGHGIINIWTNNKIEFDPFFFYTMLLVTIINTIWNTSVVYLASINKHIDISFNLLLTSIISLFIAYATINKFGLLSIPVSMILCELYMSYLVIKKSLKYTGDNMHDYFESILYLPIRIRSLICNKDKK